MALNGLTSFRSHTTQVGIPLATNEFYRSFMSKCVLRWLISEFADTVAVLIISPPPTPPTPAALTAAAVR